MGPYGKDVIYIFVFNNNLFTNSWYCHGYPNGPFIHSKLEHDFLETQNKLPQVYWGYIDGIFAIWTHIEPALNTFIENSNCYHPSITFTTFWSAKEVTFLDIRVYLKDG